MKFGAGMLPAMRSSVKPPRVAGSRRQSDALQCLVAMSTLAQSWFVALLGRPDDGATLAERARSSLCELDRPRELAFAYSLMFMSLYLSAQYSRMEQIGQEMLELSDDPWMQASAHAWIPYALPAQGNIDQQELHLAILKDLIGPTRNYWMQYWWHLSRALTTLERGDIAGGREILEHMLTIVKAINMKRGLHHTLYVLGITARSLEDYAPARAYLQESIRVAEELGGKTDITSALVDLALTMSADGQTEQALELAATAYAHPLSDQITIWNGEPVQRARRSIAIIARGNNRT